MNRSKINDPRYWELWRKAGAVGNYHDSVKSLFNIVRSKDRLDEPMPGVVCIAGSFYVKTPAALRKLLQTLRIIGYKVQDNRKADYLNRENVSVRQMEKNGWSLWYASFPDNRRGKCCSCNSLISTLGIKAHGHKCEICGEVTYLDIIDGSTIRFSFVPEEGEEYSMADIKMTAQRWDTEAGYLYLYPTAEPGLWLRNNDEANEYLHARSDRFEIVVEKVNGTDQELVKIPYKPRHLRGDDSVISVNDVHGHHWNHKVVRIWEGQEFDELFGDFPVLESISICETWHWYPRPASPGLHEQIFSAAGRVSRADYYYQDGRPAFWEPQLRNMRLFVKHFTTLDLEKWDQMIRRADRSGPGMIKAVANFCHPRAKVRNDPNIGNLLIGYNKLSNLQSMTDDEVSAMADAWKDDDIRDDFLQSVGATVTRDRPRRGVKAKQG